MFNPIIKNKIFSKKIYQYLGDITGEYKNKPVCDEKKQEWILPQNDTIVMKLLNKYRDEFDENNVGYAVYNLVEIIKTARGELSGCDLSRLDLRKVTINGVICSRNYNFNKKYLATDFSNSKIDVRNIFDKKLPLGINNIMYNSKGDTILISNNYESIEFNNMGIVKSNINYGNSIYDEKDNILYFDNKRNQYFKINENISYEKIYISEKDSFFYKKYATIKLQENEKIDEKSLLILDLLEIDFIDMENSFIFKKNHNTKRVKIKYFGVKRENLSKTSKLFTFNKDKSKVFLYFKGIIALEIDLNNIEIINIYISCEYFPFVRLEYNEKGYLFSMTVDNIIKILYFKGNRIQKILKKYEEKNRVNHLKKLIDIESSMEILEIKLNNNKNGTINTESELFYRTFLYGFLDEELFIKGCNFSGVDLNNDLYNEVLFDHFKLNSYKKKKYEILYNNLENESIVNFERTDIFGGNSFHYACRKGDLLNIIWINKNLNFKKEKYKDTINKRGANGFHYACLGHSIQCIDWLNENLDFNKDKYKNSIDYYGNNGFHYACMGGKIELVEWLNENLDFNGIKYKDTKNYNGFNGFHYACAHGNLELIIWLDKSLDFNGKQYKDTENNEGINGFHYACANGKIRIVSWLNEHLDFNGKKYKDTENNEGTNGFHYACAHGKLKLAEWLNKNLNFKSKKYQDTADKYGGNGFHYACAHGEIELVKWLNENLDFNGKKYKDTENNEGANGCHYACRNGNIKIIKWLNETLDFNGKKYKDTVDRYGGNIFHYACRYGQLELVKWLIDNLTFKEVSFKDTRDENGMNGFHYACSSGNVKLVKWIHENLDFKGQPFKNTKDRDGLTGMEFGLRSGNYELINYLEDIYRKETFTLKQLYENFKMKSKKKNVKR